MKMACTTGWMAGIVAAVCCPADVSGETAEKPWFVFNEDFGNYCVSCGYVKPEKKDLDMLPNVGVFPFGVEGLRAYIDAIARGKVTHFAMCMNAQRPCFPSKTIEPVWSELDSPDRDCSPIAVTEKALVDRGIDRYAVWIARCRERGVSPWLSVRMNDMHGGDDPRSPLISTFWREHPEYRRLPDPTKLGRQSFWKLFSLDYSHVEVRERMLAFLGECMDRYDADGLDLDFTRFPWYLTPGREREQAPLLTDFMRKVRALVSTAAARRGHSILLSVRTVSSPDVVEACGLDLPTWAKEGLVDVVSVCNHFQTADYEIPIDTWRSRLGPRIRLLTGIDYGLRVNGIRSFLTREEYLGWADVMRSRGVGDFYFYNLYGYDYASDIWHRSLTNGFDAAAVAGAPRAYPLSYRDQGHPDVQETYVSPWPVRLERPFACSLPVGSVPTGCKAELVLGFKSRPAELPAPRVNGHPAGNVRDFRREHVPHAVAFALNAADVRAGENRVEVPALPGVEIVYIALRIDPTSAAVKTFSWGGRLCTFTSTEDSSTQSFGWYEPEKDEAVPLVVALHTWGGSCSQEGPAKVVAEYCAKHAWAMVYPDFRGPNVRPEACGSDLAVQDILDAVAWARRHRKIDADRIYVIGSSGGGHMSLLLAGRHPELFAGAAAFCPITDLARWQADSTVRQNHYAQNLVAACGGLPSERADEYAKRSPLTHLARARTERLPVYIATGVHDGHTGSVPVGHAIRAYNVLADEKDRVTESDIAFIEKNEAVPDSLRFTGVDVFYNARHRVYLQKTSAAVRLTLFEGGHADNYPAGLDFLSRQRRGRAVDFSRPETPVAAKVKSIEK